MNKIKEKYYNFAVSDFDGTLADSQKNVSEETINVIKGFQKRGGDFCVCTGRMAGAILPILKRLDLTGLYIAYNGAEICDIKTGKKVYKNHVDNTACVKILEYAETNGYDVIVYPDDVITVNKISENIGEYVRLTQQNCRITLKKVSEVFKEKKLTSGKVLVYSDGTDENTQKMVEEIKSILGEGYNIGRSNKSHIDITNGNVTKGSAVKILSKIVNKDLERLICFGDELNDRSMLEIAGLSCVTANGNDEVKKIADVITDSSDDDGVKKAMEIYCI